MASSSPLILFCSPLIFSPRKSYPFQPAAITNNASRWNCSAIPVKTAVPAPTLIPGGSVTSPAGFRAAGICSGLKASGKKDLAVVICDTDCIAGAVFTKSIVKAAPVLLSEMHVKNSNTRAIVINSGQANAATGELGRENCAVAVRSVADALECTPEEVLIASTGVIGVLPDIGKLKRSIPDAVSMAIASKEGGLDASEAIMTTDLRRKSCAYTAGGITVGGMAKGSGMIHPNMATMLAVITCDAGGIPKNTWNDMVRAAADASFNCITVDGDTSTNDCVFALNASNASDAPGKPDLRIVQRLLNATMVDLAKRVARDGEGSSVLLEVCVTGASSDADARSIARTVASSSLFKAAVFGCDPNWGRIAAAVGRSPVCMNSSSYVQEDLDIALGGIALMKAGQPVHFDEKAASAYLKSKASASPEQYLTEHDTVRVDISVGGGSGSGTAWGCDLSYKYVEINAEYTT